MIHSVFNSSYGLLFECQIESEKVIGIANYRTGFLYILRQPVDIVHMYEREKEG